MMVVMIVIFIIEEQIEVCVMLPLASLPLPLLVRFLACSLTRFEFFLLC